MVSDRHGCLPKWTIIVAVDKQFSTAEACYEIVRRAIVAMDN